MFKIIYIITFLLIVTFNVESKIFKESAILSETQVFRNNDNVLIDSIIIQTYSTDVDSLKISIYKERNSFNQYLDSVLIYQAKIMITEKGFKKNVLNLSSDMLEFKREDVFIKVESLNSKTKLQTSSKFNNNICDYELFNRFQFYSDNENNQVYGKSNYLVEVFTSKLEHSNLLKFIPRQELIDTTRNYSNLSNLILVDINMDDLLDLIVEGDLYINKGKGYYTFEKELFQYTSGINIVCDLNNDKNIELINLNLEGDLTTRTLNDNAQIINQTNFKIEDFDENFEELLLNDYNKDGQIDIIIKYEDNLKILINEFPKYSEVSVSLDTGTNYLDYWKNKIIVHNSNSILKEDNNLIFDKSDFNFRNYKNNSRLDYINDSLFNMDLFEFKNDEEILNIERRIFSPKEYYNLSLDNQEEIYSIIISSCNCENNYIFRTDSVKINDVTELTPLKNINLKNSIFADITNDGYKEIISIVNEKIRIYENNSKDKKLKSNKTIITNYIQYTNHNNNNSYLIPSFKKFGKNQIYGSFSLNDFKREKEAVISLDDEYYKVNNYQFEETTSITANQDDELVFSPNPFNENTTLLSERRIIKKIKIFNNNGTEVFKIKPNSYEYIWNGKSSQMNTLAQGVYYYEIYIEGSQSPITGQIIKVVEK